MVIIYTDGSCNPNPGRGGWAFIAIYPDCEYHVCGGEEKTTNNRMELLAIIEAIAEHSSETDLVIVSDSTWAINCAKGVWKRKKNLDLWRRYDGLVRNKNIIFRKVKAHSGDYYNELVDKLAKKMR